ncbi:MAG: SAP domain-containing protein [bacterium]|nr:SAP domain-containing protein [bacterium]
MDRPILNKDLDSNEFRDYYYLKEELIKFCKDNNLQTTGSKIEPVVCKLLSLQNLINSSFR